MEEIYNEATDCVGPLTEEWMDVDGYDCTMDACTQSDEMFYSLNQCDQCPRLVTM